MNTSSIYIHIPFCEQICFYCDFNKFYIKNQPVEEYVEALLLEMQQAASSADSHPVKTIYLGGGTPTALETAQLEKVIRGVKSCFRLREDDVEMTVEVNPGEVEKDKLAMLYKNGVNRLSIGVQSFDNTLLKKIGRTHSAESAISTVNMAKAAGFSNLSIDLMFGLPGQTMESWEHTIDQAMKLDISHVSAYSLKIEEKTMFYNWYRQGRISAMEQDEEAMMFEVLLERLTGAGIFPYEISNFARPGMESRHNITYWKNEGYFGFGAGAHGYADGRRYANIAPLTHYIEAVKNGKSPKKEVHEVPLKEQMEEEMFMGLRMREGVSRSQFKRKYGSEMDCVFSEAINDLINEGLLLDTGETVQLTEKGKFLGNEVFERFLLTE
ncbi:radical SAM family heme chaperone HemW [Alteribacillus sp. HJP-4]|uniref:radical SAM family heme chaperone HemW n=1 Tax=Alteribacillus sp. HJP-4 TaxID=2775394 RepID=UPI0035CD225B